MDETIAQRTISALTLRDLNAIYAGAISGAPNSYYEAVIGWMPSNEMINDQHGMWDELQKRGARPW